MNKVIEAHELPQEERVFLKKDFMGWRIVHPIKIDGKVSIGNLIVGGKRNLLTLIVLLLLVLFFFWIYNSDIEAYQEVYENPCSFCKQVTLAEETNSLRFNPYDGNFSFDGGDRGG